jgi:hypothetical protein
VNVFAPSPRRIAAAVVLLAVLGTAGALAASQLSDEGVAAGGRFTRGPFLTRLSETHAALRWRVDGPGAVTVRASAAGAPGAEARGGRFTGLRPDTLYRWTATVAGGDTAHGAFTTAPRTLARPLRFAVIGDYGSGNEHERAVARVLAGGRPRFVLTAGDNSYLTAAPPLLDRNIFRPLAAAMRIAPLWAAVGEHDLVWRNASALIGALDSPGDGIRFTVRYGPVQVVVLGLQAGAGELAYARRALMERGPAVRFVVVHRPLQPGNPILPLLRRARVTAVFAGHLHRYERRVVDKVLQLTVGTGGQGPGSAENTPRSADAKVSLLDYGLLRVTVTPGGTDLAFVDEHGRVRDRAWA